MTRCSYLRLVLPGLSLAHRHEAVGACFEALTAPIIPLADLWDRPPTREAPQRALYPDARLERLAGIQRRPVAELEADVHLASVRAFRKAIDEAREILALARAGIEFTAAQARHAGVLSWEEVIKAYCFASAFADVRLGWQDAEAAE